MKKTVMALVAAMALSSLTGCMCILAPAVSERFDHHHNTTKDATKDGHDDAPAPTAAKN